MVDSAAQLMDALSGLKEKRKNGDLDPKAFYRGLLEIMKALSASLVDEVDRLDAADVRAQIPLLLVILDDQIKAFGDRG